MMRARRVRLSGKSRTLSERKLSRSPLTLSGVSATQQPQLLRIMAWLTNNWRAPSTRHSSKRDGIGPATTGAVRDAVEAALNLLDSGAGAGRGKAGRQQLARQPMAQEGRAAVVPPQRHERDRRRTGQGRVVGQGRFEIRRLGRQPFSRRRLSRGARRDRAARRLCRARRGADAVVRQSRRLCGFAAP